VSVFKKREEDTGAGEECKLAAGVQGKELAIITTEILD
jgi:hypothetical protein